MTNSESVEMYLKSLAELGGSTIRVPVARIAERLGVSPVSAGEMIRRLSDQKLVDNVAYKGALLTKMGRVIAENVIRRQRLWECFLIDCLHLDWARAHEMACDLEHATAPEVAEGLAAYMDYPELCPHGNPIPLARTGDLEPSYFPMSELPIGESGMIRSITPESVEVLAYLDQRDVRPGKWATLLEAAPLDGLLTVAIEGKEVVLGRRMAELIQIEAQAELRERQYEALEA